MSLLDVRLTKSHGQQTCKYEICIHWCKRDVQFFKEHKLVCLLYKVERHLADGSCNLGSYSRFKLIISTCGVMD